MDSILLTIKKMLEIDSDFDGFDMAVIAGINSAIFSLSQIGIGPDGGYSIEDANATWDTLFNSVPNLEAVKTYIFLKTKLQFDPPQTSFVLSAMENQINQLEWRLQVEVDPTYVPQQ